MREDLGFAYFVDDTYPNKPPQIVKSKILSLGESFFFVAEGLPAARWKQKLDISRLDRTPEDALHRYRQEWTRNREARKLDLEQAERKVEWSLATLASLVTCERG